MQKARRHCIKAAPTACRRMVSGSLSLSLSECFSPFLHSTCTLSVSQEYLALPDGPGGFAQNFSCSALLRITLGHLTLRVRDFHPLRYLFPKVSTHVPYSISCSYYPVYAIVHIRFGLFPVRSPLLRESLLFSLPAGTKMFQFPAFALHKKMEYRSFQTVGCPIRRLTYQRIFAPTRHFSQLITSFFASVSQGIHHAPLFTSSLHMIPDFLYFIT